MCVISAGSGGGCFNLWGCVLHAVRGVGLGVFCLYCVQLCKGYPQLILVTRIVAGEVVWRLARAGRRGGGADLSWHSITLAGCQCIAALLYCDVMLMSVSQLSRLASCVSSVFGDASDLAQHASVLLLQAACMPVMLYIATVDYSRFHKVLPAAAAQLWGSLAYHRYPG